MASDLTPKILSDIRDELRGLRTELEQTNVNVAVVARVVQSIDGRLRRAEQRQRESTFLPRRVDALEDRAEEHERRLQRLETSED